MQKEKQLQKAYLATGKSETQGSDKAVFDPAEYPLSSFSKEDEFFLIGEGLVEGER